MSLYNTSWSVPLHISSSVRSILTNQHNLYTDPQMPIPISSNAIDKLNNVNARFNLDISGVAGFFGGDVEL